MRIGVRDLRQNASLYLRLVKQGETVEVTERGHLIALLVPPEPASDARSQLLAEGRLRPATTAFHLPVRPRVSATTEAVLDELRDER